jgi:hypothetical protein
MAYSENIDIDVDAPMEQIGRHGRPPDGVPAAGGALEWPERRHIARMEMRERTGLTRSGSRLVPLRDSPAMQSTIFCSTRTSR